MSFPDAPAWNEARSVAPAGMPLQGVLVLAGTSSGVGKTSLSIGLMAALRRRGMVVQAFKVGPDFLDPLHHEAATGRPSINLDGWMMSKEQNAAAFLRATGDADVAIVEGVMGLFDGRDGSSEDGSTAQIAKWLGAPVVLVLDCWAIARSAAAVVKGYTEFDPDLRIGGLLLNKVGGAAHTKWLQDAITSSGVKACFLGGVPKDDGVAVKETYLGLHMPDNDDIPGDYLAHLADLVDASVDIEAILSVAATATPPDVAGLVAPLGPCEPHGSTITIAVARDAAFGFYYRDNLALLEAAGAHLAWFSPMEDPLPDGISGIYLGGGYPEMHAQQLSANSDVRAAIAAFARAGGVVYAECGGLMYLSQSLKPAQGPPAAMVGVFPFRTVMTSKMKMGYVEVTTQPGCRLFPPGATVRGQIYHFSEMVHERIVSGLSGAPDASAVFGAWQHAYRATMQIPGAEPVDEGYFCDNVLASYVHLHFGSNPEFAYSLVACCRRVDVERACNAAHEAVHPYDQPRRGSDDNIKRRGSTHHDSRRGSLSLVRSVPNLARMPPAVAIRRGKNYHSDRSSEEGIESVSSSPRVRNGFGDNESSSSGGTLSNIPRSNAYSRENSGGDYSRSSSRQDTDSRDFRRSSSRCDSPEGFRTMPNGSSSSKAMSITPTSTAILRSKSAMLSPARTPPLRIGSLSGRLQNGFRDGSLPSRAVSGMLEVHEPGVGMQRSASAMVHSAFAVTHSRLPTAASQGSNLHLTNNGYSQHQQQQQQGGASQYSPNRSTIVRRGSATLDRLLQSSPSGRIDERQRNHRSPSATSQTMNGTNSRRSSTGPQPSEGQHHPSIVVPPNSRIVSLLPSGTQILCALGLASRVVGVSDQCEWPSNMEDWTIVSKSRVDCKQLTPSEVEDQMQAFKHQGVSAFEVDSTALASLRPGLVLTQDACATCDVDTATVQAALQRAGLIGPHARSPACVITLHPRTIAEALESILQVGEAAGASDEACQLVDNCRTRLRRVAQAVAATESRPRVLSLEGLTPLVLGGQWLPDMKDLAGGVDEWQQPGDSPLRITWEQVRLYAPEVLILSPCGAGMASATKQACELAGQPGWWALPAVRAGAVFIAHHSLFSRPGPWLVEGVEALARMLHPDLVTARIPGDLVRKLTLSGGQRCRQSALASCFKAYS